MVERRFTSMRDLAAALAKKLIGLTQQSASPCPLAIFSGGQTPSVLWAELVRMNPDWSALTVTLTDERCVPAIDPQSNAGQLRRQLLSPLQRPPKFIDLLSHPEWLGAQAESLTQDVIWSVIGMGLDGHTASLFPSDVNIVEHLNSNSVCVQAEASGLPSVSRISFTPKMLCRSRAMFLLLQGEAKWEVYQQAKSNYENVAEMPVRVLLREKTLEVYWAP